MAHMSEQPSFEDFHHTRGQTVGPSTALGRDDDSYSRGSGSSGDGGGDSGSGCNKRRRRVGDCRCGGGCHFDVFCGVCGARRNKSHPPIIPPPAQFPHYSPPTVPAGSYLFLSCPAHTLLTCLFPLATSPRSVVVIGEDMLVPDAR